MKILPYENQKKANNMQKDLKNQKKRQKQRFRGQKWRSKVKYRKIKKTYPSTFQEVSCVQISLGYLNSKYRLITE